MSKFPILIEDYIREKQEGKGVDFCAADWLDSASKRASQISIVTHVVKFLHSDAKGISMYAKQESSSKPYLYTRSLRLVKSDFVGNAAAMDVAGLLQIEEDGVTLLDLIAKEDASPLAAFADSAERLQIWMSGFKKVLSDRSPSSHILAKQVYFPIENGHYHLLAPLYPSSLNQALDDCVKEDRFGEKAKEARECKKKEIYSDSAVVNYPNLAYQQFGGSKPQNISRLNSVRRGKAFLLSSVPPSWKQCPRPPKGQKDFWKAYQHRSYLVLKEFKDFLVAMRLRNNKDIREKRKAYVNQLLDLLFQTAAEIQGMTPGWSTLSDIPLEEQIWLDFGREDLAESRLQGDWMEKIAQFFARWVIGKLEHEYLSFFDILHHHFRDACVEVLKEVES